MVEMEWLVGGGTRFEWRPGLSSERVSRDRLEIAFVRELEHEDAAGSHDAADLCQRGPGIFEMVQDANADRGIEVAVGVRQGVCVARDDREARVPIESFARRCR